MTNAPVRTMKPGARKAQRRSLLRGLAGLAASALVSACSRRSAGAAALRVLDSSEWLNSRVQHALAGRHSMAEEFTKADISPRFPASGTKDPDNAEYQRLAGGAFADWRLSVAGRVARPARFSLADLRAMPSRTQITRHDCVDGWSVIGQWTGVQLSSVLARVQPLPDARYIVFRCADPWNGTGQKYYESVGMGDAYHPQTILAYALNGAPLPIKNGAPLRVRIERQLGYKMAKYLMRIEVVSDFAAIGGNGGTYEDNGYAWYAGI